MRADGGEARRITDTPGRRRRLRVQPGRPVARLPHRQGGRRAAVSPPGRRDRRGRARGGHHPSHRRRHVGVVAGQPPHLLRLARHASIADEKLRREKKFTVNIRNPETPLVQPVGADARSASDDASDRRRRLLRGRLHHLRRQQVGRVPRPIARPLQAQHHAGEPLRRPLPARGRHRHRRAADQQRRDRRERRQLLARRPVGRVLGAGRPRAATA